MASSPVQEFSFSTAKKNFIPHYPHNIIIPHGLRRRSLFYCSSSAVIRSAEAVDRCVKKKAAAWRNLDERDAVHAILVVNVILLRVKRLDGMRTMG